MASTKSILRLASRRPLSAASQITTRVQGAALFHATPAQGAKQEKPIDYRTAPPDLLSELRKAPRPRE